MQSVKHALRTVPPLPSSATCISCRSISLTGAITRGLRESQRSSEGRKGPWRDRERGTGRRAPSADEHGLFSSRDDHCRFSLRDDHGRFSSRNERGRFSPRDNGSRFSSRDQDPREPRPSDSGFDSDRAPRTIPYTTASSEFIYGSSAVNAAIRARRRKLHKLYIHNSSSIDSPGSIALQKRADAAGVPTEMTSGSGWKMLFDRMADHHPHNGCLLEVSPIPVLPVTSLDTVESAGGQVSVQVGRLTQEDAAVTEAFGVEHNTARLPMQRRQKRFPIFLLLDRVTDLGNLGAIIRSAYYFGVNAIVLLDHGTAPLNAITVKASTGAAELMPILRIKDEADFISASKANGWHFVSAISPEDVPLVNNRVIIPEYDMIADGLGEQPVVLMLGNEGEGLRPRIARQSDSHLTIQDAHMQHSGVESLNVSVAAGILMHQLLRPFLGKGK